MKNYKTLFNKSIPYYIINQLSNQYRISDRGRAKIYTFLLIILLKYEIIKKYVKEYSFNIIYRKAKL